jgi:hypothetical protein
MSTEITEKLYREYLARAEGYFGQPSKRDPLRMHTRESILSMAEIDSDSISTDLANICTAFYGAFDPCDDFALRLEFLPIAKSFALVPGSKVVLQTAIRMEIRRLAGEYDGSVDSVDNNAMAYLADADHEDLLYAGNETLVAMGFDSIIQGGED